MGYAHIENLYRPEAQLILNFKWCYALEKIHGTSAHVRWAAGQLSFFSGGEKYDNFVALFDQTALTKAFTEHRIESCTVFGEAYGGKQQGMSKVYGPKLRFVAFDVQVNGKWFQVPAAQAFVTSTLGLDFVWLTTTPTDVAALDALRDGPCQQSLRNGAADNATYDSSKTEGVVLRPPFEVTLNNGERICAKHKRAEFCERKTPQAVDAAKLEVLQKAEAIAEEWVTEMRLTHVLDKLRNPTDLSAIPKVIAAMLEDVLREASGEIVDSKDARKAISAHTVKRYKDRVARIPA